MRVSCRFFVLTGAAVSFMSLNAMSRNAAAAVATAATPPVKVVESTCSYTVEALDEVRNESVTLLSRSGRQYLSFARNTIRPNFFNYWSWDGAAVERDRNEWDIGPVIFTRYQNTGEVCTPEAGCRLCQLQ